MHFNFHDLLPESVSALRFIFHQGINREKDPIRDMVAIMAIPAGETAI